MTTILLMLMLPIGAMFYYHEIKNRDKYQAVFDDFIKKVDESPDFSNVQKIQRVRELFLANRYEVSTQTDEQIVGERKILSMGLLMMGLFFYVFYFFFFQKPHIIVYKVKNS